MIEETKSKPEEGTAAGVPVSPPSTTAPETPPAVPQGVPAVPKEPEANKESSGEEKIEVTKKFLEEIQRTIQAQQKDIGFLKSVADAKAVALWHQRHKSEIPPIIKIRVMDVMNKETGKTEEKVIVGWGQMRENRVWEGDNRKWLAVQTLELLYQDGSTSGVISLTEFNRRFRHIQCQRTGVITDDKTGELFFKLVRQDTGEELTINATFVN